ncbi:hypothetical protein C8R43DRAFT_1110749 [Mycena crocata]|nr:hypothetical protein C8R43DRAFT_1110749 [Mycena crocata]
MAPRQIESDSDSSGSESDGSRPSSPVKAKAGRLPSIDFSTDKPTVRKRAPSSKSKELNQRASDSKDAQIAALMKKNKSLSKKNEAVQNELRERDARYTPPESEEENEAPVKMSSFSDSFVSKGIVGTTAQKPLPKKVLRKSGETPVATPMSAAIRAPLTDLDGELNARPEVTEEIDARSIEDDNNGAASTPQPTVPHRKRRRSRSPSSKKKSKRPKVIQELPKAQFVAGKAPGGSRTNLSHYTEPAAKLIKSAMHRFEVRIWTVNPFPSAELQVQWVKEIWDEVCTEADALMELTERMSSMIKKYGSHGRSSLKDGVRPLVAPTYKFKIGDSDKVIRRNVKIWKALTAESAFHYADTAALTGYAGNAIIIESMRVNFFKNKRGRGILYGTYFSPISLVTLALIFTAIEFCIEEYSTGRFQQGVFDETANVSRYEVHLRDLTEWAALKPSVTDVIRQRMHDQLRSSTGTPLISLTGRLSEVNRARALQELEAMELDDSAGNGALDSDLET